MGNVRWKKWLALMSKPFLRIIFFILTCLVLIAAILLVYRVDPAEKALTPACSFYLLTGLYCPGCGMTRALHNVMHGRIGAAFSYNLLWPFFSLLISGSLFLWFYFLVNGKSPFHFANLFFRLHSSIPWVILVIILTFWILRNIRVYPLTYLAP